MNKTTKLLLGATMVTIIIGSGFLIAQKPNDLDSDKNDPSSSNIEDFQTENLEIENNMEATYENYVNQDFNIQISYPNTYELQEGLMGILVFFFSPIESSTDLFQENFNVMIQDLSAQPMSLEEYTDLSLGQIETVITDSEMISSKETILDGESAYEVIYTGTQGRYSLKWKQLWTVLDNKAYVLTSTSEVNEFDDYSEVFDTMFDSFEISN